MTEMLKPSYEYGKKDRRKIRFSVKTPIHIGTRDGKLTGLEFLSFAGNTYIINEDMFSKFLFKNNLLDDFTHAVSESESPLKLLDFLVRKEKKSEIPGLAATMSRFKIRGQVGGNDFRPFIRDGANEIYIPATSIKGALRTAIIYGLLKADKDYKKVENRVQDSITRLSGKPSKGFSSWLQNECLSPIRLTGKATAQHRDIFRCLSVRDAYPIGKVDNRVIKVEFLCKGKSGKPYFKYDKGQNMVVWAEVLVSGEFETEIFWDNLLFNQFQSKAKKDEPLIKFLSSGLDSVFSACFEMSHDVADFEKKFFPSVSEGTPSNPSSELSDLYSRYSGNHIRIGYGSGMLGTTVNLLFEEEVRQEIRNRCGIPRNGDPAPKSRRVYKNAANQWLPLGWLAVTQEGETGPMDSWTVINNNVSMIPSDFTILMDELSGSAPMSLMAINSVRERLEKLSDAGQRATVAKAIITKLGQKEYKKYKYKSILDQYISEGSDRA